MRILIILTLIFGINYCNAQSKFKKKIIGKWVWVTETSPFFEDLSILEQDDSDSKTIPPEKEKYMIFNKDKTVVIYSNGSESKSIYKLTDSILTLGIRNYTIVEVDKKKLIFKLKVNDIYKYYKYKKVK